MSRFAVFALLFATPAFGQNLLKETAQPGTTCRYVLETTLVGTMKIRREQADVPLALKATNSHRFDEKTVLVEKEQIRKVVRHYETATASATVGTEETKRELRENRRLVVAQRSEEGLICYSPSGPLTRAELEVVSEHFDVTLLGGLLPEKETSVGETWKVSPNIVQGVCLFEGLLQHELTGTLEEVKNGLATVSLRGTASGIELGAMVKLTIDASLTVDLLNKRVTGGIWKQKDLREQGPASPAIEAESTTKFTRELLTEEPATLSRTVLSIVPADETIPEVLKQLLHREASDKFTFLHARDWHMVGRTDNHVVLRLLERGDFLAQASITLWRKEEPGKHMAIEDFKRIVMKTPTWTMEEVVELGEIPSDEGRFIYRIVGKGDLDGTKVVQNFMLLADKEGRQVIVTITCKPAHLAKIGTRDVSLVNAIEFLK